MGDLLHRKALNYFRQYMIVGGMPQAVLKYCESKNLSEVNVVKQRILKLYRQDILKLANGYDGKALLIFDEIPSQLTKHEKKFTLASLNKNARFREIEIDFLVRDRKKICSVEVKSEPYKKHTSLDRFGTKYSNKVGKKYIVYTKDLSKDGDVICVPVYMAAYL